MKKILAVTGIRSEYFILQPVLDEILKRDDLSLKVVVTGTHLSPLHGETYKIIEKDGYDIIKLESLLATDSLSGRCKSLGIQLMGLVDIINQEKPDWLLVLGDREESLVVATAGVYLNIPVAHICGGDRVVGNVDDSVRHAVTKLAHLHFPATKENGERILRLGEEKWRVFVTGNPALDSIRKQPELTLEEINDHIGTNLKPDKPFILLINHSLSSEYKSSQQQMAMILEAVASLNMETIIIYPNSDAGSAAIVETIEVYTKNTPFFHAFKTLQREIFVNLQRKAALLLGNSSSGILEAPFLKLPVVNVGNRQKQRQHAENIIFVEYEREKIIAAIKKATFDQSFLEVCKNCKNPYGDGFSGERIARIIAETEINNKLISKQIVY
ncbi:UDP-N-acetylglucosamine 2-epimerase [Acetobacterium sp. KB-1]|jgi:GDP/UDP-N,N'-diacetylbacillosamine 2-epimerase (hydrolysing)|uniref:UDP-N-acetylglucosamine 2-epimerase n=1 Tax=Acetobacterium sp. KB-1 TaxID=2184575 RepID=UPI000DBECD59|nr:UDP-N-acetylglucosamine 2-epimerase [Acetobacterium sp. KB-1]AWW26388.1 UDP-N-acetylglucosamine 2-epimerase (hydrolyzing) [Acetobacterium sp. KB-1]